MRISIRVSNIMDKKSRYLGSVEDRVIRIPQELRDVHSLELGEFVTLRSSDGGIVALKVSLCYNKDVAGDALAACVTRNVFGALQLKEIEKPHEQEIEIYEGITLGCDPELFLVKRIGGELVHASKLVKKYGQVGHDGLLLEIRPLPSTSEVVLTQSIWQCLYRARKMLDSSKRLDGSKIMLVAASYYGGLAAGFHLHFGIPKIIRGGHRGGKRWSLRNQIARALDYYVGIPSIIPEGETDNARRSAQHIVYGKPGEWRQEGATFEYRVPGGSLLRHPVLTMGIIGLGAIVMEDAMSRIYACTDGFKNLGVVRAPRDLQEIYPNVPDIFELYKTISSVSIKPAMDCLESITNDITQMVGFERRKKSIEPMFRCLYNGTKFSPDVENNWRLFYNEKQQRSVDVLSA